MNFIERFYFVLKRKIRKVVYKVFGYDLFSSNYKKHEDLKYFLDYSDNDLFGKDIRSQWEENRFQWILPEIFIYLQYEDKKILSNIFTKVDEWIENNPCGYGINWINAMEPAIRVSNWLLAFDYVKNVDLFKNNFNNKFSKSVEEHFNFIKDNLEITLRTPLANHYLSNIAGLLYISVLFPQTEKAVKWRNFSIMELENSMDKQVFDDGVSFENSIGYHRFVLEIFLYCAVLCHKNNITLSVNYWKKLEKMIEFVKYYTKPDGSAPGFGDEDDGFWHLLSNGYKENINDHKYLLAIGYKIFGRADFKDFYNSNIAKEINLIIEDVSGVPQMETADNKIESKSFADSGIYVMRSKDIYISIITRNKDKNKFQPHKHNDIFSFELTLGKENFIIDSGTYCYTSNPTLRNYFRSTEAHNTVKINDIEQQDLNECGFFSLPRNGKYKTVKWETGDERDSFEGIFERNYTKGNILSHKREFVLDKKNNQLEITDTISGKDEHGLEWFFHIHPDVIINKANSLLQLKSGDWILTLSYPLELSYQIIDSFVSFRFVEKVLSKTLKFNIRKNFPYSTKFIFTADKLL